MHGSSSVPQEWLEIIRKYGGQMKETYGVPVEEIVTGIKHGVRKINIDTDIRLAMTGAIRRHMGEKPSEFDPRKYLRRRAEGRQGNLQVALRSVRLFRPSREDQAHDAGEDGRALQAGRAEPDRQVSFSAVAREEPPRAAPRASGVRNMEVNTFRLSRIRRLLSRAA